MATVEEQLLELENQYWQAIKDRDVETALRLSDDPCMVVGAQGAGSVDKKTLATMLSSGGFTVERFTIENPKVRVLTNDVAIVTYKVREELTVGGQPLTLVAADASTWIRRKEGWVCALHTESIAGDPFGRDRRST